MLQEYEMREIAEDVIKDGVKISKYAWHYIGEEQAIELIETAIYRAMCIIQKRQGWMVVNDESQ